MAFSILILTLNEETNLRELLAELSWCDDLVVLDSGSTDRTVEVAGSFGAQVFQRKFDDFAGQRNWAIDNIQFKHPLVFHLDADERFTDELRRECEQAINEDKYSGFFSPFKMMFQGKWLRHGGMYPGYQMRLMKRGEVRFVQKGHGQREHQAQRGIGFLRAPLLHYNFSKGWDDWFEKHNRYSSAEAAEAVRQLESGSPGWSGLLGGDGLERRRALKDLSYRLPGRPWLKFIYLYFLRLGFLDGSAGLTYCVLQALYEYLTVLKTKELRGRRKTTN
jgi:glycosyltransferase involved in cell wall biosynthesis